MHLRQHLLPCDKALVIRDLARAESSGKQRRSCQARTGDVFDSPGVDCYGYHKSQECVDTADREALVSNIDSARSGQPSQQ